MLITDQITRTVSLQIFLKSIGRLTFVFKYSRRVALHRGSLIALLTSLISMIFYMELWKPKVIKREYNQKIFLNYYSSLSLCSCYLIIRCHIRTTTGLFMSSRTQTYIFMTTDKAVQAFSAMSAKKAENMCQETNHNFTHKALGVERSPVEGYYHVHEYLCHSFPQFSQTGSQQVCDAHPAHQCSSQKHLPQILHPFSFLHISTIPFPAKVASFMFWSFWIHFLDKLGFCYCSKPLLFDITRHKLHGKAFLNVFCFYFISESSKLQERAVKKLDLQIVTAFRLKARVLLNR